MKFSTPTLSAAAIAAAAIVAMGAGLVAWNGAELRGEAVAASGAAPARADLLRHLERSPKDGRGWVLLARTDFEADRYAEAAVAYERALAVAPKVAADPAVWCEYADALGMAQGGSLAGKPRELVLRALTLSPAQPKALEMAGSAAYEAGEYASAVDYWRQLQAQLAPGTRERRELETAIARVEAIAGPAAVAAAPVARR